MRSPRTGMLAGAVMLVGVVALLSPPAAAEAPHNCDFNGDQLDDLAVGVPREDARNADGRLVRDVGAVNEFASLGGELVPWDTFTAPFEPGSRNGESLICADFNSDGYDDLAIGIPFKDDGTRADTGRVEIVYGGPLGLNTGPLPVQLLSQNTPGMRGRAQAGDVYGFDMTWCDFDGDGFADIAIGIPGKRVRGQANAGAVHVVYGSASGLGPRNQIIHQSQRGMRDRAEADDFFGEYLTAVRIDNDPYCDLVVGIPSEDIGGITDAGAVQVVFGGPQGLTRRNQFIHRNSPGVKRQATAFERFGAPLFYGQFRPSAGFEIVVGVPGQTVAGQPRAGAVHILAATRRGLSGRGDIVITQNSPGMRGRAQADDQFGRAVIVGRFDDDEFDDLAVGVPGERVAGRANAGQVQVIFGTGRGLSRRNVVVDQRTVGITPQRGSFFGSSLAAGDFDGDGRTDLAVGTPFANWSSPFRPDGGAVHIVRGGATGLAGQGTQLLSQELFVDDGRGVAGVQACDRFGNFNPSLTLQPPAGVGHPRCDRQARDVPTGSGTPLLEGPMSGSPVREIDSPDVLGYGAPR